MEPLPPAPATAPPVRAPSEPDEFKDCDASDDLDVQLLQDEAARLKLVP